MAGLIDETALEAFVRRLAREEAARPVFVTQKNVETVVGLPRRDFLEAALAKRFPSAKEGRRRVARTVDVLAYYERQIALREARPQNDDADAEGRAFARVGARRVSR